MEPKYIGLDVHQSSTVVAVFTQKLSLGLAVLLIVACWLGMLFSQKTHREQFASAEPGEASEAQWPLGLALATQAAIAVLVALVSEVFVESVYGRRGAILSCWHFSW